MRLRGLLAGLAALTLPMSAFAGTIYNDQAVASVATTIYADHNVASGTVTVLPPGSAITLETGPYGVNADWWYGKDNATGTAGWIRAQEVARTPVTIPDGTRWVHATLDDTNQIYQLRLMVGLTVVDTLTIGCGRLRSYTPDGTYQTLYKHDDLYEDLPSFPGVFLRWWQTWRDDGAGGGSWGLHTWVLEGEGFPKTMGQYGRVSSGCLRLPRAQDVYNFLPLYGTVYVELGAYAGPTTNNSFDVMVKRRLADINVRSGPGTQNAIVGHAAGGQVFHCDQQSMGWYRITYNGQVAWIWGALLTNYPEAVVQVNPTSLAFTMTEKRAVTAVTPAPASAAVSEPGGKYLWSVQGRPNQAWLTAVMPTQAAVQIYVNDGANALAAGSYSAAVAVVAVDAVPASVAVTLTVLRDTDGDGIADVSDADDDNDGLGDTEEIARGTNTVNGDTDGDGASDLAEVKAGSDPKLASSTPATAIPALFKVKVTVAATVREGPGGGYAAVGSAAVGQIYDVYKQDGSFYLIVYGGRRAWITTGSVERYVPPPPLVAVRVNGTGTVNVRSGPGTGYAILGTVPGGQIYVSATQSGGWYKIRYDEREGWILGSLLTRVSASTVKVTYTELNVRTGPGTGYSILGKAYANYRYGVAGSTTGWTKIWYRGRAVWVYTAGTVRVAL